jgi:hypothetical protein
MKAPTPRNLVRYYGYWGIDDIFTAITRTPHTRSNLRLKLEELVQKRNNIAHGDASVDATQADVASYEAAVKTFCTRADAQIARRISRLLNGQHVW